MLKTTTNLTNNLPAKIILLTSLLFILLTLISQPANATPTAKVTNVIGTYNQVKYGNNASTIISIRADVKCNNFGYAKLRVVIGNGGGKVGQYFNVLCKMIKKTAVVNGNAKTIISYKGSLAKKLSVSADSDITFATIYSGGKSWRLKSSLSTQSVGPISALASPKVTNITGTYTATDLGKNGSTIVKIKSTIACTASGNINATIILTARLAHDGRLSFNIPCRQIKKIAFDKYGNAKTTITYQAILTKTLSVDYVDKIKVTSGGKTATLRKSVIL